MTKLSTVNTEEYLYNQSQIQARNVTERQYRIWKRRFPLLSSMLAVKVEISMAKIKATSRIHHCPK